MNKLVALLKREILEHKSIWRVPAILIGISALLKLSLVAGNLSFDLDMPDQLQLDDSVNSVLNVVIAKTLGWMNYVIMLVMFIVAIFYALSCLFTERQDESVLFWRSLPISDSLTVASKLLVALVVIPLIIVCCQVLVVVLFFATDSIEYLTSYYLSTLATMGRLLLWSMLPIIAWCILCSEIAKKNPFLLAFITPILLILVDKLFLNGVVSQAFIINRLTGISDYTIMPLIWGVVFSAVCFSLTVIKRSERI